MWLRSECRALYGEYFLNFERVVCFRVSLSVLGFRYLFWFCSSWCASLLLWNLSQQIMITNFRE